MIGGTRRQDRPSQGASFRAGVASLVVSVLSLVLLIGCLLLAWSAVFVAPIGIGLAITGIAILTCVGLLLLREQRPRSIPTAGRGASEPATVDEDALDRLWRERAPIDHLSDSR